MIDIIKNIIFDWDGVIADTPKLVYNINISLGRKFKGKTFADYEDFRTRIHEWRDIYQNIEPSNPNIVAEAQNFFREEMKKAVGKIKLYAGMRDVIVNMSKTYDMGIASHSPREVIEPVLRKYNIEKYFDTVTGCYEAKKLKPHPEHLRVCMKALGAKPKETCKIGDANFDIEAARAAKLARVVGVSWGIMHKDSLSGADAVVDKPAELIKAIEAN